MASYTIELRKLCDYYTREVVEGWFKDYRIEDYLTLEQIQTITEKGVWNKDKLARKIVDHYYMREIGFETPMLFEHYVKMKMQEIMEDYLPVIYSNSSSATFNSSVPGKTNFPSRSRETRSPSGITASITPISSYGIVISVWQ